MDSMEIIRHGKFYSYNGELYANTFPEFWAVHQEPETGTECSNCMTYGGWNGVFCIYCANCAEHVYQGTRGSGVIAGIQDGEYGDPNNPFAAANTYLKNIKLDDIGDRDISDSRAIYGLSDDHVYLTANNIDFTLNVIDDMTDDMTDDITDDMCMRKLRDKAFEFIELEEDEVAELDVPPLERQDATVSQLTEYDEDIELYSESDDEYFEQLEASAASQDNDPFIIKNLNFGTGEAEDDESDDEMPALEPVSDDESDDEMPALEPASDDEYADMPELIPHPSMYPCNPDFDFMVSYKNEIKSAYKIVQNMDMWNYLLNHTPDQEQDFMWSCDPKIIDLMNAIAHDCAGHSGCSLGMTMRILHFIAKNGYDVYREEMIRINR